MVVDKVIERNLSFYSKEYANTRKEYSLLVNDDNDYDEAKIEDCNKKIHEIESNLVFLAMKVAGYKFDEKDGVLQYIKD